MSVIPTLTYHKRHACFLKQHNIIIVTVYLYDWYYIRALDLPFSVSFPKCLLSRDFLGILCANLLLFHCEQYLRCARSDAMVIFTTQVLFSLSSLRWLWLYIYTMLYKNIWVINMFQQWEHIKCDAIYFVPNSNITHNSQTDKC